MIVYLVGVYLSLLYVFITLMIFVSLSLSLSLSFYQIMGRTMSFNSFHSVRSSVHHSVISPHSGYSFFLLEQLKLLFVELVEIPRDFPPGKETPVLPQLLQFLIPFSDDIAGY